MPQVHLSMESDRPVIILGAYGLAKQIQNGSNVDQLFTQGRYYTATREDTQTMSGSLPVDSAFVMDVYTLNSSTQDSSEPLYKRLSQDIYPLGTTNFYRRYWNGISWSNWFKFEGTEIVPSA